MSEITYIIGYKHSLERFNNLRKVLKFLDTIPEVKTLIVEVGDHSSISHLNLGVEIIFIESNVNFYNRSWVFNIGLSFAKTAKVAFGDCDIILSRETVLGGIKLLDEYDVLSPYSSIIDLDEKESLLTFTDIAKINRAGRGVNDIQVVNISGGILFANKDAIIKIGGWCELFEGWGGEDDALTHVILNKLKWFEMPFVAYHLYHKPSIPKKDQYNVNLRLMHKIKSFTGKYLDKFILDNGKNNGRLNKYKRGT